MAEEHGQERTEQATPKRRNEARERGEVVRSRELTTTALLLAGAAGLLGTGGRVVGGLTSALKQAFTAPREVIFDSSAVLELFGRLAGEVASGVAPLLAVLTIVAAVAPLALGGWVMSGKAASFQWQRLDPISGLKRHLGLSGLGELAKGLAKFTLLGLVGCAVLWSQRHAILQVGYGGVELGLRDAALLVSKALLIVSAATVLIAALDVPFQLWQHGRKLKMTRQELREEAKETEGRPEVRARIRAMQQEIARRRMMADVPTADVIITNPTHYAVALRYEPGQMAAPRLLAKGVDEVAERIRAVAREHNVTLLEAPPLARALYFSTKIGQEIPAGLYHAVAQVLAYVFQLKSKRSDVTPPRDLPIPNEFLRDPPA